VIAPAAADLEIALGEALANEPAAAGERDRREIARLDVRLEAVQSKLAKGPPQDEQHAVGHVTQPRVGGHAVVAQERALERPPDDLAEGELADDRAVHEATRDERLDRLVARPRQQRVECRARDRRRHPRPVQATARPHRGDERVAVARGQRAHHDTGPLDPHAVIVVRAGGRHGEDGPRSRGGPRRSVPWRRTPTPMADP
jgi:hypothetical protein